MSELASLVGDNEIPEQLLDAETRDRIQDFQRRLEASNLGFESYFRATGQSPDEFVELVRLDARRAIKIDLALRAVAAEEGLEPTTDDIDDEVRRIAEEIRSTPERLRDELDRSGRMGSLRAEKAKSTAADWVLERVTYVDETGAEIDRTLLETDDTADSGEQDAESDESTEE
jgi:trigger factor